LLTIASISVDLQLIATHLANGLMTGLVHVLVAAGVILSFGVLDVFIFSRRNGLPCGVFTVFVVCLGLTALGGT
jgi:branched-subunit amino acid ABC-type transport system permease component